MKANLNRHWNCLINRCPAPVERRQHKSHRGFAEVEAVASRIPSQKKRTALGFGVAALLLMISAVSASAQSTMVTSNPADGATDVSPSASVVFTFSAAMNPSSTTAFFETPPTSFYPVTSSWSAGNTVLTCKPMSPFPGNTNITWIVSGMDASSGFVTGSGTFSTGAGSGGGGGGSGTNATTSFTAGKLYFYEQTNSAAPVQLGDFGGGHDFTATTALASNRTATAISLSIPGWAAPTNLTQNFVAHEDWYFFDFETNQQTFETMFPQGDYVFNVTGTPNNLQGTVTLPTTMQQPNAPHFLNFSAIQGMNAAAAFTVKWDPFTNGTAADVIILGVSDDSTGKTVFATPGPGTNGALSGTALSVTIPAATLAPNSTNTALLSFYRFVVTSNANYVTFAFRATGTQLHLFTTGGVTNTPPTVSHPVWTGNGFGFDVAASPNQVLKVRYSTDCSLPLSQWSTIYTTNSPGTSVHINVTPPAGPVGFMRLESGP